MDDTSAEQTFVNNVDDFIYKPSEGVKWPSITESMSRKFAQDGFVIIRQLFNENEIAKLAEAIEKCEDFWKANFPLMDTDSREFFQSNWNDPGTDILGMTARNAKLAGVAQQLLNRGELYMYSGKVIMKQAKTGGALIWHQDYGYWYNNRAVFPDFITCVIALTKSDQENGGLEVIRGNHHCGRIDHAKEAGQTGADPERVQLILKHLSQVAVNLKPGDVLMFHANLLHKSEPNVSTFPRWNLIFSYNTKENSPDRKHYNAQYSNPLNTVPADALILCENLTIDKRQYVDPLTNPNVTLAINKQ